MSDQSRIEWSELRSAGTEKSELFFMIAESDRGRWRFFERSSWEVRWYEIPSSPNLIAQTLQKINANCYTAA